MQKKYSTLKVDVLSFEPHAKYGFISIKGDRDVTNNVTGFIFRFES